MDILCSHTAPQKWQLLAIFDEYRHVRHPFPAAIIEVPAHALCICSSHP